MKRLRVLRAEKEMTLRELAQRSGVSKDAISEIERGLRMPRVSTVLSLAEGLGVDPQELLGELTAGNQTHVEASGPFTAVYQREGEWWIGFVEELPGANAQERTLEEARESLKEAVSDVLEANRELTRTEFESRDVVREPIGA